MHNKLKEAETYIQRMEMLSRNLGAEEAPLVLRRVIRGV